MSDVNEDTWDGKVKVVAEQAVRFKDGEISLTEWASTLYSFRDFYACQSPLHQLAGKLVEATEPEEAPALAEGVSLSKAADRADVLSTILLYLSQDESFSRVERQELWLAAERALHCGFEKFSEADEAPSHTLAFLLLTEMEMKPDLVRGGDLGKVAAQASGISDPKQRERVYRKIGMLYRRNRHLRGYLWSVRAFFARSVPPRSRAKALAAFRPTKQLVNPLMDG